MDNKLANQATPAPALRQADKKEINGKRKFIGLCKTNETKNLQKRQALPARPPPNKFEGATLYSINNAKLNS